MTIEHYSEGHYQSVLDLIKNFHAEAVGTYDGMFDPEAVSATIRDGDHNNCFLVLKEGKAQGILYGVVVPSMTSNWVMFQELIWYINKPFRKYGLKLLREAERMLKLRDINVMIMAVLENSKTEKLKRFYERIGYKPMETHYMRTL